LVETADCEYPALHAAQLRQQLPAVDQDVFARTKQQFQRNARAWSLRGARRTVDSSVTSEGMIKAILCWRWFLVLWPTWETVFVALSICLKSAIMVWFCLLLAALDFVMLLRLRATSAPR
jgi:hypothetical protein